MTLSSTSSICHTHKVTNIIVAVFLRFIEKSTLALCEFHLESLTVGTYLKSCASVQPDLKNNLRIGFGSNLRIEDKV